MNFKNDVKFDASARFHYLAKELQAYSSKTYSFYWDKDKERGVAEENDWGGIDNFKSLQFRIRQEEENHVMYYNQLSSNHFVNITCVTSAALLVANCTLKDGSKKKFVVLDSQKGINPFYPEANQTISCALPFVEYVNLCHSQGIENYADVPIFFTALKKLCEKFTLWDRHGEVIGIDFGFKPFPVFGHMKFKNKIPARIVKSPLWPNTMDVYFTTKFGAFLEHLPCILDARRNCLQAIEVFEMDIDLNGIVITSSKPREIGNVVYKEFLGGQGRESNLFFLPYDNIFSNVAYKPNWRSKTGLEEVPRPYLYSQIFNASYDNAGIVTTKGEWYYPEVAN